MEEGKKEIGYALIQIWERQGLSYERMQSKAKELGSELPDWVKQNIPSPPKRIIGETKSGYFIRSFRPIPKIKRMLDEIPKGERSRFINNAILFYSKNKNDN